MQACVDCALLTGRYRRVMHNASPPSGSKRVRLAFRPGIASRCPRNAYGHYCGCFGIKDSQAGQRWPRIDHDPLAIDVISGYPGADGMVSPVAPIRPHPMTATDLRELPFSLIPEHRMVAS
jgi:hypothetical protein